jgi:hypothetical protein
MQFKMVYAYPSTKFKVAGYTCASPALDVRIEEAVMVCSSLRVAPA